MSAEVETLLDAPWSIPSSWKWSRMGQMSTVITGGTPSTLDRVNFEGGTIPWITPADLSGFSEKIISCGARSITQRGLDNSGAQLIPKWSVIFSSRAPIGYVAIAGCQLTTNQGCKSFALGLALTSEYVYYYLQRAKGLALKMASGTTFLELSKKSAESLPIPLAPLPEQRRIVEAIEANFARLEAGVAALERVRRTLRQHRASLWKSACEGKLGGTWGSWPQAGIFDATDDLDGLRVPVNATEREGRPRKVPYYGATGQVGWIDKHLFDEELVLLGEDGVDFFDYLKPKAYVINGPSWVNNHAHVLRCRPEKILAKFLEVQLNAANYSGLANGTTRLKLTKSAMRQIPILLPSISIQRKVVDEVERRLSVASQVESVIGEDHARAGKLRESILQRAFEGSLVPQDPNDEPASALLERIKHERSSPSQSMTRNRKAVRAS